MKWTTLDRLLLLGTVVSGLLFMGSSTAYAMRIRKAPSKRLHSLRIHKRSTMPKTPKFKKQTLIVRPLEG